MLKKNSGFVITCWGGGPLQSGPVAFYQHCDPVVTPLIITYFLLIFSVSNLIGIIPNN